MCDYLDELLASGDVVVDHALVPVRDLHAAAESRRDVMRRSPGPAPGVGVPGGLWHTADPTRQERVLEGQLYKLVRALARHDVPTTLLDFPRLVRDARYLHAKLAPLLPDPSYERFAAAFAATARPGLVHDFPPPRA
jgi:hypothetical protein